MSSPVRNNCDTIETASSVVKRQDLIRTYVQEGRPRYRAREAVKYKAPLREPKLVG